jgi:hypothetical protein
MMKEVRVYSGFEAADAGDRAYYASLTPAERVDILLDIVLHYRESLGEAASRFERVHRTIELSQS